MNHAGKHAWEREYQNPTFLSLGTEPSQDVKDFVRYLRKKFPDTLEGATVLDLGCGNGKNLPYMIDRGAVRGVGYDISETAIRIGKELCAGLPIELSVRSIGAVWPLQDSSIDIALDIMAFHLLSESERDTYLSELARVMKSGGRVLVRTLAHQDKHAKRLIDAHPGRQQNSYILPEVGVEERVFSREELESFFTPWFAITLLEKSSGYQRWEGRSYKRVYWVIYLTRN